MKFNLTVLPAVYAVSRLEISAELPDWIMQGEFFSITRTPDELSIICEQNNVPQGVKSDKDWRALKIKGQLEFSLVGVLADLTKTLADGNISIFAISTYDTDYLLVKNNNLEKAEELLEKAGHMIA